MTSELTYPQRFAVRERVRLIMGWGRELGPAPKGAVPRRRLGPAGWSLEEERYAAQLGWNWDVRAIAHRAGVANRDRRRRAFPDSRSPNGWR